jgi:uncharacterized protein (DUF924 family)
LESLASSSTVGEGERQWVARVLDFWFRELDPAKWFAGDASLDQRIRTEFGPLHARIASGVVTLELSDPRTLLAAIIVADQFSRNMFRGLPGAFSNDALARSLSEQMIALGLDLQMTPAERHFAYLPFEHSENREHQALAVGLIEALGDASWTFDARGHEEVIKRFGRFPHRNRILGRISTNEELAYLAEQKDSWG